MSIEIDKKYKRKATIYTVKKIDETSNATYIYVLADGLDDKPENYRCYGKKVFDNDFKFIKEDNDG